VTEPGRQQRQAHLNVLAVAVPVDHRGHREGVPQVMQPGWPAAGLGGQTGGGDDLFEGNAQGVRVEGPASAVDEHGGAGSRGAPDPLLAGL
jgi:hypothetical protein